MHVVEVGAGAVGFKGEHVVCAGWVGDVFEGEAEVVGEGVWFVGEDVFAEDVVCGLPLVARVRMYV